jgi:NTP pyrophosphatase (non-canonical NTP hydrolase)
MSDSSTTIADLKKIVEVFCTERQWGKYHNPKDLAIGIITEASELLEHFRFKSVGEAEMILKDPTGRQLVSEEVGDVLFFLIRFCQKYDLDLATSLRTKIRTNSIRYPLDKAKGSNKKYSEL